LLQTKITFLKEKVLLCPLFANLPPHEQNKVFLKSPAGIRKIVLSTNIAETSVTITGVRYVVDCGLVKQRSFKNTTGVDALKTTAIS